MGYSKALGTAMEERLVGWFLFKRNFPLTIEQLASMMKELQKPFRWPQGDGQQKEMYSLISQIKMINSVKVSNVPK